MRRKPTFVIIFFMCLALSAGDLQAEVIEIAITAEIAGVFGPGSELLKGQVNVGDIITGSCYVYDSNTPDSRPSIPSVGEYWHTSPPYGITLRVGGFVFQTDPNNVKFLVGVSNNRPYGDGYWIHSYNNLPLYDDVKVYSIGWQLRDYTGTAISSDALPTTPPVLEDWMSTRSLSIDGGIYYHHEHRKHFFWIGADVISVELVPERIEAAVDVEPDTLNLASKGKWLTCYISLPEDYNVADIDPNTVILQNEQRYVEADWLWFEEGEEYAMAKFGRLEVQDILEAGEDVELTITGQLTDGTRFEGTDTIRVIDKGGRK